MVARLPCRSVRRGGCAGIVTFVSLVTLSALGASIRMSRENWVGLESNPEVLTQYAHKLGGKHGSTARITARSRSRYTQPTAWAA